MAARKASPKTKSKGRTKSQPSASSESVARASAPPRANVTRHPSRAPASASLEQDAPSPSRVVMPSEAPQPTQAPSAAQQSSEAPTSEPPPSSVPLSMVPATEPPSPKSSPPPPPRRNSTATAESSPESSTPPPPPSQRRPRSQPPPPPPRRGTQGPTPPPPSIRMMDADDLSPLPPPVRSVPPTPTRPAAVPAISTTPRPPGISRAPGPPPPPSRAPKPAGASPQPKVGEQPTPDTATSTLTGLAPIIASSGLSMGAYGRVISDARVTAPSLADRAASARRLLSTCEEQLRSETSRSRKARLCYEIARLYEGPLDDFEAAGRFYHQAHSLEPKFEPTLAGLIRVRARLGQWDGTLRPLEEQSELSATPKARAALLFVRAVIQEVHLKHLSEARADYERALALCPGDASLLSAVERHARREQDYKALGQALGNRAQVAGKDRGLAAALMAERARIANYLRKQSKDAAVYYEQAFSADPLASAAAFSLEQLLLRARDFTAHAELLRKRAEFIADPSNRASTLISAAALLIEGQGELLPGAQLLEMAWQAEPSDLGVLGTLADVYERAGDHAGMVSALVRLESRVQDPRYGADLCVLIGETMGRRLGKKAESVAFFQKARATFPGNAACVQPLCEYFADIGDWAQVVAVLAEEESQSGSRGRRAELHARMAELFETKLGDVEQAIAHYRASLGLDADSGTAFRQLARLLESTRRYEELVALLERAIDRADNQEVKFAHLFKMGQIFEDLLSVPERAVLTYQRILEDRPDHLGAFFALQRAAERAQMHDVLVAALVGEAKARHEPGEKLALLHRAAEVTLDVLHKPSEALEIFGQVLAIDKHYAPTLSSLSSHYEGEARHTELLKVLILQLSVCETPREKVELLLRMGRIAEDALGDDQKALGFYLRAHETLPETHAASLAVQRCLARLGKDEELATFLATRLETMEAGVRRAELWARLGQLYEIRLGRLQDALTAYEKALLDRPTMAQALDGQLRVLEQRGDIGKAADALLHRGQAVKDPAVRTWARLRRGELLETAEKSGVSAADAFQGILEDDAHQPAALLALGRIYTESGDNVSLSEVMRRLDQSLSEKGNRVAVLRELLRLDEARQSTEGTPMPMAEVMADVHALLRLDPMDRAALTLGESIATRSGNLEALADMDQRYPQVLEPGSLSSAHRVRLGEFLEPRNPIQALEQFRPALEEDHENVGAARGMSRIAEVVLEPELLIQAARVEAEVVRSPAGAASLRVRAAELLKSAGDELRAVEVLKEALAQCPTSLEAAAALHELLTSLSKYDELLAVLSDAAQQSQIAEVAAEHWVAVAQIYANEKGDLPAAIAALGRLEKSGRATLHSTLALSDFYLRDRQWVPAVGQLRRALSYKPDEQTRMAVHLRLAEVFDEHLKKATDATRELREVLQVNESHQGALRRLLVIQMKGNSPAALETARQLVELTQGRQKAEALTAQGKLLVAARQRVEAVTAFSESVSLIGMEPSDAADGLRSILEAGGPKEQGWSQYETALATFIRGSQPGDHQARVYLELSEVLSRKDSGRAAELLNTALTQNPTHERLRLALVEHLKKAGRYREALPELAALLCTDPLRAETWRDLVEVHDALGNNAESHLATGPLVMLGQGTELQRSAWNARVPHPAMLGQGAFSQEALNRTLQQAVSLDALTLLETLGHSIAKVFPPELERWGTSARHKVGPRGPHPARGPLDRLCHCFGGLEIDLYPSETEQRLRVVLTDPIGILVPANFSGLSDVEQVFYLGGMVANIARQAGAVDALDLGQLRLLLGAGRRIGDSRADVDDCEPKELAEVTRRLSKSLPWLSKGRIDDAARRYASVPAIDVKGFVDTLRQSALRASMILADDLRPVIQLGQGQGGLIGFSKAEAEATMSDLMGYWASAEAVKVRRAIGAL